MKLDWLIHPIRLTKKIKNQILIVGNPRSGTTFIHRYLSNNGMGTGSKLYQMIFPSIILQKLVEPFLPFLEKISPARYHSDAVHKTSLRALETDDPSLLFRFFGGFFLYAFILSWADEDLLDWFQHNASLPVTVIDERAINNINIKLVIIQETLHSLAQSSSLLKYSLIFPPPLLQLFD